MQEKRTEMRTFIVRLMCDKCDGGEMLPTGNSLLTYPPKYQHKCNKCDHMFTPTCGSRYPRIDYEPCG